MITYDHEEKIKIRLAQTSSKLIAEPSLVYRNLPFPLPFQSEKERKTPQNN